MAYNFDDMEILGAHDQNELTEPELLSGEDLVEQLINTDPVEMLPVEENPAETVRRRSSLAGQGVNKAGMKLNLDVTVVMDLTGSMENLIEAIKRDVVNFRDLLYDRLAANLEKKRKDRVLHRMRLRVIGFRDYNFDWEAAVQPWHGPMVCSDFFDLDDEFDRQNLQEFVNKLEATGGEDEPESALEAIHYAINSPWDFDPDAVHRHVIMVFTDASAHPLTGNEAEDQKLNEANAHYPTDADMPYDIQQLQEEYQNPAKIDTSAQRIIVFAPKAAYPWSQVGSWNGGSLNDVVPAEGLTEVHLDTIVNALTGSIGGA